MMTIRKFLNCIFLAAGLCGGAVWADDVVGFDPGRVEAVERDGRWKVVCGDLWLIDFGPKREAAARAAEVIRHYGMNEQRFVGEPTRVLGFYTVSGRAPVGAMPGEDAIRFNPANLAVSRIDGSWKIVDGDLWLVDFGSDEFAARAMLREIGRFGFDHIAFVGRPDAPMTYFRASGEPAGPVAAEPVPADGALLNVTVIEGERGPAIRPAVTLRAESGATPVTLYENPARFDVAPGRYLVSVRVGTGTETPARPVELAAGRPVDLTINTATGTLVLALTAGGRPLESCPNVSLKSEAGPVAASSELPARFQAQEGEYFAEIEFAPAQVHRIPGLRVEAGRTREVTAEVPCGTLVCRVVGSADRHPYVEVRNPAGMVAAQAANPARFQLLAGEYTVGVRSGDRLVGSRTTTLAPGGNYEVEIRP